MWTPATPSCSISRQRAAAVAEAAASVANAKPPRSPSRTRPRSVDVVGSSVVCGSRFHPTVFRNPPFHSVMQRSKPFSGLPPTSIPTCTLSRAVDADSICPARAAVGTGSGGATTIVGMALGGAAGASGSGGSFEREFWFRYGNRPVSGSHSSTNIPTIAPRNGSSAYPCRRNSSTQMVGISPKAGDAEIGSSGRPIRNRARSLTSPALR